MIHLIVGTSILLGAAAQASAAAKESECRATYIYASDEAQTIDTRFATWTVQAILIGCRKDLESIDSEDRRKVLEVFRAVFVESDLQLLLRLKTPTFRDEVVKRINRALNRPAVSDIAFLSASRSE